MVEGSFLGTRVCLSLQVGVCKLGVCRPSHSHVSQRNLIRDQRQRVLQIVLLGAGLTWPQGSRRGSALPSVQDRNGVYLAC